jgi:hypothetical protein
MCHPGLSQTNRYDQRMDCIGQAYFTYYGQYRDERAGKMVVVLLSHLLRFGVLSRLVLTAFWPRAAQSLHAHTFCVGLGHLYTWQGGTY